MNRDNALVLATLGAYNLKQTTHSQIQCLGGGKKQPSYNFAGICSLFLYQLTMNKLVRMGSHTILYLIV